MKNDAARIGVDFNGYIRTVGEAPLQAAFVEVIDDLSTILRGQLGDLVHSAYLYGSVARADAVAGRSDLDVVLVLASQPTLRDQMKIETAQLDLEVRHPVVSKVDFDLGVLEDVLAPGNLFRWGFWLKHHCRCIYGNDLTCRFKPFRPSRKVARAVNGDFPRVLEGYARRIETETDASITWRLVRECSKKVVRSTNVLRPTESPNWPDSLASHIALFVERYPKMTAEIAFFHSFIAVQVQEQPKVPVSEFVMRLRAFSAWMQGQATNLTC